MASGSKDEKAGAPALDDAKTEREAGAASGEAPVPPPSGDSPKPHGDKMEKAVGGAADTSPGAKG